MQPTYSKNYFEKYAALSLLNIYTINANDILLDDCPDLRIPKLDFGIEVTQALTKAEAIEDKKKPIYAFLGINPFNDYDADLDFVLKKIENACIRKEIKSKHYQKYQSNGLYIFSHYCHMDENTLLTCFQKMNLSQSFYQYIYINAMNKLFIYHIATHTISTYRYSMNELITMNQEALIYESTCFKARRKITLDDK